MTFWWMIMSGITQCSYTKRIRQTTKFTHTHACKIASAVVWYLLIRGRFPRWCNCVLARYGLTCLCRDQAFRRYPARLMSLSLLLPIDNPCWSHTPCRCQCRRRRPMSSVAVLILIIWTSWNATERRVGLENITWLYCFGSTWVAVALLQKQGWFDPMRRAAQWQSWLNFLWVLRARTAFHEGTSGPVAVLKSPTDTLAHRTSVILKLNNVAISTPIPVFSILPHFFVLRALDTCQSHLPLQHVPFKFSSLLLIVRSNAQSTVQYL